MLFAPQLQQQQQQQQQQGPGLPPAKLKSPSSSKKSKKNASSSDMASNGEKKKKNNSLQESFPCKVYRILMEAEAAGEDDIISFTADGDCFEIHQPTVFADQIIPRHFRHSKLTSFHRQCGLYGFKRLSQGPNAGAFMHPMFRKGQPELCEKMRRTK